MAAHTLPLPQATSSQLAYTSYVLGALTAGGGIMGYVKARSLPSVLAGCSIGLLCKPSPFPPIENSSCRRPRKS